MVALLVLFTILAFLVADWSDQMLKARRERASKAAFEKRPEPRFTGAMEGSSELS